MLPQLLPVDYTLFRKMRKRQNVRKSVAFKNRNWKRRFYLCVLSTRSIEINGYFMTAMSKIPIYAGKMNHCVPIRIFFTVI